MSQSKTLGTQSRKSYVGILLLTVCAFLTQTVLTAPTDTAYGDNDVPKDNEFSSMVKRPAFFVGSRYGRSSGNSAAGGAPNQAVGTSKTRRLIIVPRNDRFFLGSRYGKRSDEYLSPYEQSSLSLGLSKASLRDTERSAESGMDAEKASSISSSRTRVHTMTCVYTGIRDFYRCSNVNADELNNIMNRNDGMSLDSNSIASEDVNTK